MSRLCRLKTKSHGDDGKWAYEEIVRLRKQRDDLVSAMKIIRTWAAVDCLGSQQHIVDLCDTKINEAS